MIKHFLLNNSNKFLHLEHFDCTSNTVEQNNFSQWADCVSVCFDQGTFFSFTATPPWQLATPSVCLQSNRKRTHNKTWSENERTEIISSTCWTGRDMFILVGVGTEEAGLISEMDGLEGRREEGQREGEAKGLQLCAWISALFGRWTHQKQDIIRLRQWRSCCSWTAKALKSHLNTMHYCFARHYWSSSLCHNLRVGVFYFCFVDGSKNEDGQ